MTPAQNEQLQSLRKAHASDAKYGVSTILEDQMMSLINALAAEVECRDDEESQVIDERDSAEECIGAIYNEVIGERPEWSNAFGYQDAIDAVSEHMAAINASVQSMLISEIADLKRHKQQALQFVSELYADRGEDERTNELCNKAMAVLKP